MKAVSTWLLAMAMHLKCSSAAVCASKPDPPCCCWHRAHGATNVHVHASMCVFKAGCARRARPAVHIHTVAKVSTGCSTACAAQVPAPNPLVRMMACNIILQGAQLPGSTFTNCIAGTAHKLCWLQMLQASALPCSMSLMSICYPTAEVIRHSLRPARQNWLAG